MAEEPQSSEVALWESRAATDLMTITWLVDDLLVVSFLEKFSQSGCKKEGETQ